MSFMTQFRVFQHTAARRRLPPHPHGRPPNLLFQHTAARRRLPCNQRGYGGTDSFNTQPPEGGCGKRAMKNQRQKSFNTQPPEGGCSPFCGRRCAGTSFNTQPPEGGCATGQAERLATNCFNTQPPEGGCELYKALIRANVSVSTHSRPKAAARLSSMWKLVVFVSTHSRPKAAACLLRFQSILSRRFNTQPPEGGCEPRYKEGIKGVWFQHTAARRRLRHLPPATYDKSLVSTHSRPKAAAMHLFY